MRDRILREVPEKRERCVKHFQMTQKGMAAAVYPAPVHYEEDGQWKEIDNRLEAVQEDRERSLSKSCVRSSCKFCKRVRYKGTGNDRERRKENLMGIVTFFYTQKVHET